MFSLNPPTGKAILKVESSDTTAISDRPTILWLEMQRTRGKGGGGKEKKKETHCNAGAHASSSLFFPPSYQFPYFPSQLRYPCFLIVLFDATRKEVPVVVSFLFRRSPCPPSFDANREGPLGVPVIAMYHVINSLSACPNGANGQERGVSLNIYSHSSETCPSGRCAPRGGFLKKHWLLSVLRGLSERRLDPQLNLLAVFPDFLRPRRLSYGMTKHCRFHC